MLRDTECAWCGTVFVAKYARSKYCCGECANSAKNKKQRDARKRDPEKFRAYGRDWYRRDPEKARKKTAAWRESKTEEELDAYHIKWRRNRVDKAREYAKSYRETHRLYFAQRESARRAKLRGVTVVPLSQADLELKAAYWGFRCWVCGGPYMAMDHVKPIKHGGPHMLSNLRPICKPCNSRKHARWPIGDWFNDIRDWTMARGIGE